jgi:hypothetical protein
LEEVDVNGLLDHSTPSALSEVLRNEAEGRIRQALAGLPEKLRIVLVLRYYNRMSYSQVANALNLPLSAVRVRIFRAKHSLRCHLRRPHRANAPAGHAPDKGASAIKRLKRFSGSISSDIAAFHPMPTSSGFYLTTSNASS